jgi:hypothetical protein
MVFIDGDVDKDGVDDVDEDVVEEVLSHVGLYPPKVPS